VPAQRTTVRITSKGQATIPKVIRQKLGIELGGRVAYLIEGDFVYLERIPSPAEEMGSLRDALEKPARELLREADLLEEEKLRRLARPLSRRRDARLRQ